MPVSPLPAIRAKGPLGLWPAALIAAGLMAVAAGVELALGRTLLSASGTVRLWVGDLQSAEMSQQLFDWYSFTHILHGILLYGVLHLLGRSKWGLGLRLSLAVGLECAWEVLENSPFIIERYRAATIALGYCGDSVLNSMSDVACCVTGFVLARLLPVWVTVLLVLAVELGLAYAIRDNLTLNIIMLIHPFEAIKHWQMGVGAVSVW